MKKILLAVATLVLASCVTAPARSPVAGSAPGAAPAAPKPVVPAVREMTYEEPLPISVKTQYPNGDPSGSKTFQYNAKGQLVRQETFNANGLLTEVRTGSAKGAVWRITATNAQNGEFLSFEDLTFGPKGELLTQTFSDAKEIPQASNEYTYDALGRKSQWLAKTGGGGLQARTVYTYDNRGNNIKTEGFDAGGKLVNVFLATFDDQSQILTFSGFDQSNTLVELTTYTWKDKLKLKEEMTKPLLRTTEFTYGDKPAPTGIVSSVRGKVVERQTLEYQWFTKTKTVTP